MAYSELAVVAETDYWHVSNVKLFDYLDQARRVWYQYCKTYRVQPLVVNININYKQEAFNNEKLYIHTELKEVRNTSFILKQTMINEQQVPVVTAEAVIAVIDLQTRQKITVPIEIRAMLNQEISLG